MTETLPHDLMCHMTSYVKLEMKTLSTLKAVSPTVSINPTCLPLIPPDETKQKLKSEKKTCLGLEYILEDVGEYHLMIPIQQFERFRINV